MHDDTEYIFLTYRLEFGYVMSIIKNINGIQTGDFYFLNSFQYKKTTSYDISLIIDSSLSVCILNIYLKYKYF